MRSRGSHARVTDACDMDHVTYAAPLASSFSLSVTVWYPFVVLGVVVLERDNSVFTVVIECAVIRFDLNHGVGIEQSF